MSYQVGQRERQTQHLIVQLFQQKLQYKFLDNWQDRSNSNIATEILTTFLRDKQGYSNTLITKALHELNKVARNQSKRLILLFPFDEGERIKQRLTA